MDAGGAVKRPMSREAEGWRVVVVGAGGVIGSHLVPHLARNRGIATLVLVDFDDYESKNLGSQDALPSDIGRPKAEVQADRARGIRTDLRVTPVVADVETLAPARLRGDLVLTCLDSRRARQHVNLVTRHLGVPWIDAGVLGDQLMARIDVFLPDAEAPCLECRWSSGDYAALEQHYPCASDTGRAASSGSSSALGALAAALQALECTKQLTGHSSALRGGDQIVIDGTGHVLLRTAHRRNPACLVAQHEPWSIVPLRDGWETLSLTSLYRRARSWVGPSLTQPDEPPELELRVETQCFTTSWTCEGCGSSHRALGLHGRTPSLGLPCSDCSGTLHPLGIGLLDALKESVLDDHEREMRLGDLGFEKGDILTMGTSDREVHRELTTSSSPEGEHHGA